MKKTLINTVIVASLAFTQVTHAQEAYENSNEESGLTQANKEEIGFGAGAIIGGIIGGPAGAMITGLASSFFVSNMNKEDTIDELEVTLASAQKKHHVELAKLHQQIKQSEQTYQQELFTLAEQKQMASQLQAENLLMSLQFNTGSSELPSYYHDQLVALADILKLSNELSVDLSGYTDLLGDSELNMKLSQARADSVKTALVDLGIEESRINTQAFGDSVPVMANSQQKSSFYDRRVMIKLSQPNTHMANNF